MILSPKFTFEWLTYSFLPTFRNRKEIVAGSESAEGRDHPKLLQQAQQQNEKDRFVVWVYHPALPQILSGLPTRIRAQSGSV
jgi:hypothetical protein